jgi:hypothetical protein
MRGGRGHGQTSHQGEKAGHYNNRARNCAYAAQASSVYMNSRLR